MEAVQLGGTGIEVSRFIFGAGTIGGIGSWLPARGRGISVDAGLERLDEARRLGIRVVDTADRYAGGDSEKAVGTWLRSRQPDEVLVATKVGMMVDGERRWTDLSAGHIARQLATSIERLGRVDLYLSHAPDPGTPAEETLEAFAAARADGRIRAYGVCNVTARELEELLTAADRAGLPRPGWVQNRLNLLARGDRADLLPLVTAEGLGYTPFSPLAGGMLSDRYLDGAAVPPDSHLGVAGDMFYPGMYTPENLARVAKLRDLGRERGIGVAGLALAWLLAQPAVTAPIVAPSTPAQWAAVEEALGADLDQEILDRMDGMLA
jgi:aryl-alcohol dehydrogenase-like predicted oxidoreductase